MSNLDWIVGGAYFVAIPVIGIAIGRGQRDVEGYFLGGRAIPWWLVWLSILAAEISAATFLGVPAFAYKRDWTYLQNVVGTILARVIVAFLFIRPYFDLKVTTVYGYLEKRFGPHTRTGASIVFLVTRVLASGVRLYMGALLLETVAGVSVTKGILLLAAVTCVYTLTGGVKAVIATDSIQVLVMFAGALAAGAVLLKDVWPDLHSVPSQSLRLFDLSPSLTTPNPTLWGGLIGGTFITLASHGTDQDIVQRLLTAKDVKSSRRALIASGVLDIPIVVVFLSIGTLLRLHYAKHPDASLPAAENEVFPWFIAHGLPSGFAGLVIAGVLSVVMGSLSAAMNALASTAVLDLWKPHFGQRAKPETDLRVARTATFVCAVLLGVVALAAATRPDMNLLDLAFKAATLTFGALLGVFLRGFLTKGGGDGANLAGMAASVVAVLALSATTSIHWNWFVPIGAAVAFTVGAMFGGLDGKKSIVATIVSLAVLALVLPLGFAFLQPTVDVRLRVVAESGAPVAGANVMLARADGPGAAWQPLAFGASGALGEFRAKVAIAASASSSLMLVATDAEGRRYETRVVAETARPPFAKLDAGDLKLGFGRCVRLRVRVLAGDKPVPRATVLLLRLRGWGRPERWRTDEQGTLDLLHGAVDLIDLEERNLVAERVGVRDANFLVVATLSATTRQPMRGAVIDGSGVPLSKLVVHISNAAPSQQRLASVTTDGEGRFEWNDAIAGRRYRIELDDDLDPGETAHAALAIEVEHPRERPVLKAEKAAFFVFDQEHPRVLLERQLEDGGARGERWIDASRMRVAVPPGKWRFLAEGDERHLAHSGGWDSMHAGEIDKIGVSFIGGRHLHGRIADRTGQGIERAEIRLLSPPFSLIAGASIGLGNVDLTGIPHRECTFVIRAAGFSDRVVTLAADRKRDLDLGTITLEAMSSR